MVGYLDDFDQLVNARATREDRRANQQLREHTALRPDINGSVVVGGAEDQLGGTIEARADVGHIGLTFDEGLG